MYGSEKGWLTIQQRPVDLLLRGTRCVQRVISDCVEGHITIDYQCGHPFGFVNAIYADETHHSKAIRTMRWVPCFVLYARNQRYLMNEKGALAKIAGLKRRPDNMEHRVQQVYPLLAAGDAAEAYTMLDTLHETIKRRNFDEKVRAGGAGVSVFSDG